MMNEPSKIELSGTGDEFDVDLIRDLERQSIEEIRRMRAHARLDVRISVSIRPGNASASGEREVTGATCDVSRGGCRVVTEHPIGVGDVYRLRFDRSRLDVGLTFAQCVRCRLLREDTFEVAFSFFAPIQLDEPKGASDGDLLA